MKSKFVRLFALLLLLAPGRLWAQGVFDAIALPTTVTATGQTEVVGSALVILRSGTREFAGWSTVPGKNDRKSLGMRFAE